MYFQSKSLHVRLVKLRLFILSLYLIFWKINSSLKRITKQDQKNIVHIVMSIFFNHTITKDSTKISKIKKLGASVKLDTSKGNQYASIVIPIGNSIFKF